jgi:hypothetical protein
MNCNSLSKKISILAVITSLLVPITTMAIDTTTSGRIIDAFKEQSEQILFETLPFDQGESANILKEEYAMNGLDALKSRLKQIE